MVSEVVGVVVHLSAKAKLVDEFVDLARRTMIIPTREASGCIRYEMWQDLDEPTRFTIIEEWESEEAHTAHLSSEWLQPVIVALQPYSDSQFDMQRLKMTG